MERIMTRGSWKAMHWLRDTYSTQQIKTFLINKGVNVLPPRELNYWLLLTNTAPEERKTLVATAKKSRVHGEGMHIEILTDAQKSVLARLSRVLKDTDFYLAGGTALALHLGHRMSQDFDWFIPRMGETEKLLTLLSSHGIEFAVMSIDIETCYVMIENIQVSFLGYDYPLLQPPILFPEYGVLSCKS